MSERMEEAFSGATAGAVRLLRKALGGKRYAIVRKAVCRQRGLKATTPYATHVPVLAGLAASGRIASVLECGSGLFSTPLFLDTRVFPDLTQVTSLEDDPAWAASVRSRVSHDLRAAVTGTDGPVAAAVAALDLDAYDLIFVDDSRLPAERLETIRQIARRSPRRASVVIHDFELYRRAAGLFDHCYRFRALLPNTGVLWNGSLLKEQNIQELDRIIRSRATTDNAGDAAFWVDAMTALRRKLLERGKGSHG